LAHFLELELGLGVIDKIFFWYEHALLQVLSLSDDDLAHFPKKILRKGFNGTPSRRALHFEPGGAAKRNV
jgi:hypothetical protein